MSDVLSGIRVLDFGRYIAGPYCAALLGDLGADVIRVERREGGEDRWLLPVGEDATGALYLPCNRNKRGMTLDPSSPDGREIVARLVATADVVVANLPPEVLRTLGLDLDSLRLIKPDIILTTVSAYGPGGPWSHRHGFDGVGQAMCGSVYLSGEPGHPTRAAVTWVDFGSAALSAFGTLAALMHRQRNGTGQKVEGALLHTALAFHNAALVEQAVTQVNREATGNRGYVGAPSDIFRTRDGWVVAYALGTPMFRRWARLMGEPEWLTDPAYATDESRAVHGERISARMNAWTCQRTTAEALAELEAAAIPAAPVLSPQEALDNAHIQAAGFLTGMAYPGLSGPAPVATTPITLSETPGEFRLRPPTLGEHTAEVLRELGYTDADIAGFRERGAI